MDLYGYIWIYEGLYREETAVKGRKTSHHVANLVRDLN